MKHAVPFLSFCFLLSIVSIRAVAEPIPLGPVTTTRVPLFNAIVTDGIHYFQLVEEDFQALWRTDGTPEGTWPVHETKGGSITFVAGGESLLYYMAEEKSHYLGLYAVSRTEKEPLQLASTARSSPFGMVASGDQCFWYYRLGDEGYLWASDGIIEGTREVRRFQYPQGLPSQLDMLINQAKPIAAVQGGVVLGAPHPEAGIELWFSDGTKKGTVLIADLCPAPKGAEMIGNLISSIPSFDFFKGEEAYFWVTGDLNASENVSYRTDGTPEGTVPSLPPEPEMSGAFRELFTIDRSGNFSAIEDNQEVARGRLDLSNMDLSQHDGYLYFYGDDGIHGWEVWRAGGAPFTVERLTDLNPGPGGIDTPWGGWQPPMVVLGNRLLFWGSDGTKGTRLWALDIK
jgi:ELWxxDGT repeat protein